MLNQLTEAQSFPALETERRGRLKAEAENKSKDEFFAFFLHELKNPLNVVHGWSRLLLTGGLDRAQTTKAIAIINRNTDFLNDLVKDLLDVSRIASGKMRIESSKVDLREIVEDSLEDCQPTADERNIFLTASFDCPECVIPGDAKRLRQIVCNLLNNSIKFTPSGGFVSIDLCRTTNGAEIVVKDSGVGIKPEFLPFIFERFRQGESGDSHCENNGLGLGLAVVRFLVELHQGCVEAHSDGDGKGATFTVRLPIS